MIAFSFFGPQSLFALDIPPAVLSIKSKSYQSSVQVFNQFLDNSALNTQKVFVSTGRGKLYKNFQGTLEDLVSCHRIESFRSICREGEKPEGYEVILNPISSLKTAIVPTQQKDMPLVSKNYIFPKTDELDLHSKSLKKAHELVFNFIHEAVRKRKQQILIITGKGNHGNRYKKNKNSPFKKGIIRTTFPQWMEEPDIKKLIRHFSPAQSIHGGDGAYYVMLR
jgi:hypothetical protein